MKPYREHLDELKKIIDLYSPEIGKNTRYLTSPERFEFLKHGLNIVISGNGFGDPRFRLNTIVSEIRKFSVDTVIIGWSNITDHEEIKGLDGFFSTSQTCIELLGEKNYRELIDMKLSPTAFLLVVYLSTLPSVFRNEVISHLKEKADYDFHVLRMKEILKYH